VKDFLSSKKVHSALGLLITGAIIIWMIFGLNWHEVSVALLSFNYWVLIPATLVLLLHMFFRSWRWRYLLPEQSGPSLSLGRLFNALLIGNFATFILPFRAGEFVRPFILTRYSTYRFSVAFISVVIERFFDLSAVLLTFAVVMRLVPGIPQWVYVGANSLVVLALAILVFIVVSCLAPAAVKRLAHFCFKILPQSIRPALQRFTDDLLDGATVLKNHQRILSVIGLTLCVWFSSYLGFYVFLFLMAHTLTAAVNLPLLAVSCAVILALAVAAPSAPGFIGVFQVACIAAFALFGLGKEQGAAYSIVMHLHQFILFTLYALYVLQRDNLSIRRMEVE
jgi:hypothetical protein